jgi:hypothetical protein
LGTNLFMLIEYLLILETIKDRTKGVTRRNTKDVVRNLYTDGLHIKQRLFNGVHVYEKM